MSALSVEDLKSASAERNLRFDTLVRRVGWALMALVIIAALLGYLGRGPLTRQRVDATDGSLQVEYYSVERYESPTEIRLKVREVPGGGTLQLHVSRAFGDFITIEQISPPPRSVRLIGEDLAYDFAIEEVRETKITLRFKHDDFGLRNFAVRLEGHPAIDVRQLVLP